MKLIINICLCGILLLSSCQKHLPTQFDNVKDPKSEKYIPNNPRALKAFSVSSSGIGLSWSDESAGETGFVVERSVTNLNNFISIKTTQPNVTTYTDTLNLRMGEKYYFRVKALSKNSSSDYSGVISVIYN